MDKKGMTGIIYLVVGLVIGVIMLVGVLIPITSSVVTQSGNTTSFLGTGAGQPCNAAINNSLCQQAYTGVNAAVTSNLVTFILIGVLVLLAGISIYGMSQK